MGIWALVTKDNHYALRTIMSEEAVNSEVQEHTAHNGNVNVSINIRY